MNKGIKIAIISVLVIIVLVVVFFVLRKKGIIGGSENCCRWDAKGNCITKKGDASCGPQ